jgi:hypothetical protein
VPISPDVPWRTLAAAVDLPALGELLRDGGAARAVGRR